MNRIKRLWVRIHTWLDSTKSLLWGVLAGFVILGAAACWGFIRQDNTNDHLKELIVKVEDNRVAAAKVACDSGADLRALLRQKIVEAPLEIGEAIIEVASSQSARKPSEAAVNAFRQAEQRRLNRIVSEIPARRWDSEKQDCVDTPVGGK